MSRPSHIQFEHEPVPFSLEPPERTLNFFGRTIKSITKDHPLATKVAHYMLWSVTFLCFGFALTGSVPTVVIPLYLTAIALIPFAYEAMQSFNHLTCREFNTELITLIGGQDKLDAIPEIDLPMGKIENLKIDTLKDNLAKGMDPQKQPFIVIKSRTDQIESIDCLSRRALDHWVLHKKVHARNIGEEQSSDLKKEEKRVRKGDLPQVLIKN